MKKILIADDELLVRIGLKSTIDWKKHGYLVVGEAKNGKECIKLFNELDADILITDIKMPVMDGLEVIQTLNKKKPGLKSIILTHYDDFAYAKQAIQLGASDYILKSNLTSENLLAVLNKLSIEIDEARQIHPSPLQADSEDSFKQSIKSYLRDLYYKKNTYNHAYANDSLYSISHFKHEGFTLFHASIFRENTDHPLSFKENSQLRNTVYTLSSNIFDSHGIDYTISLMEDRLLFLLNFPINGSKAIKVDRLLKLITSFRDNLIQFLDVGMYLGVSSCPQTNQLDQIKIHDLFHEANIAFEKNFFDNTKLTIFHDALRITLNSQDETAGDNLSYQQLKDYVLTSDEEGLNAYIDQVFDAIKAKGHLIFAKNTLGDFLSYGKILREELNINIMSDASNNRFSYSQIEAFKSFKNMHLYIKDLYTDMIQAKKNIHQPTYSYAVQKSMDFIASYYAENIALNDVAEYAEISKSYLSVLFKQETGINFSTYLINYRIEAAKKLLVESNLKMYQIAEQVGFVSPYYFSKVFKENTGITCKHYRESGGKL